MYELVKCVNFLWLVPTGDSKLFSLILGSETWKCLELNKYAGIRNKKFDVLKNRRYKINHILKNIF